MNYLKNILLTILLIVCPFVSICADDIPCLFKPISINPQLPTAKIRNLYQDREGYLWICTYSGLFRYDGYTYTQYNRQTRNTQRTINPFINTVCEDMDKNLWIGTHHGVFLLNKENNQLNEFKLPGAPFEINVESICCDHLGNTWIGTSKGLYLYDRRTRKTKLCDTLIRAVSHSFLDVKAIIEDDHHNIWAGTWEQGLVRYDRKADKYYRYLGINPAESAHTLYQDSQGIIWIGTWRYGLYRLENAYDPANYSFKRYAHEEGNPRSILDDIIYTISEDRTTGTLWIGSRQGLSLMDRERSGSFVNYSPNDKTHLLPFNEVDALLNSRDGIMWVGMLGGGIYKVDTHQPPFVTENFNSIRQKFATSSVTAFYPMENGDYWLSIADYGLGYYHAGSDRFVLWKDIPHFKNLPYVSAVNQIIPLHEANTFAFATWDDGVWVYNGSEVKRYNDITSPTIEDRCINSVCEDSYNNLWIGSRSGMYVLTPEGRVCSLYDLSQVEATRELSVTRVVEAHPGEIWFTTTNDGVWRIQVEKSRCTDIRNYSIENGKFGSRGAMTLCADTSNDVWVGSMDSGLFRFSRDSERFQGLLQEYFPEGQIITGMISKGNAIWLTTNNTIYKISPSGGDYQVNTFTDVNSQQPQIFNVNANGICGDRLLFGGAYGLTAINEYQKPVATEASGIAITNFNVFNRSIYNMPHEELQEMTKGESIDYADEIVLKHNQNNFSIEFAILNYIAPKQSKYQYRLKGYDAGWNNASANNHIAQYSNLPSGTYVFRARGYDWEGNPTAESRPIRIVILPAPWRTWWAYCIYGLLFLALVYYAYRTIRNRIKMRQELALEKIERQKTEEVNHSKLKFFTNITHELLTPLTIISASVEEIRRSSPEHGEQLNYISNNTTRLIRLIQQILEFRKIENGKQQLRVSLQNISGRLKQSVDAFSPLVRKKGIVIVKELSENEVEGFIDVDKFDKIVYNLLSNAAKYTLSGRKISVSEEFDSAKGEYKFSVINEGEPISEEQAKRIFERFYEGEHRKFHTIGTGIGLSLTKDLVELHKGTISLTTDSEKGNIFTVTLPVRREAYAEEEMDGKDARTEPAPEEKVQPEPVAVTEEMKGDHSHNLLLVEDNEELLASLARTLSRKYNVITAQNGVEGFKKLKEGEFDIIVSDVMMPEMDGFELCRLVKETFETAHIPIILLTARREEDDQIEGYRVGADAYICKPFSFDLLEVQIDNLLKKKDSLGVDSRKKLVFDAVEAEYTSEDKEFMDRAVTVIEEHLSDNSFDVTRFAEEMGLSKTTFNDRLKKLSGMSPNNFISSIRLDAARKLLENNPDIRVSDVAYSVGYNDPKYFSTCFKKKYGMLPKEAQTGA